MRLRVMPFTGGPVIGAWYGTELWPNEPGIEYFVIHCLMPLVVVISWGHTPTATATTNPQGPQGDAPHGY